MTEATGSGPCCGVPHPLPVLAGDDDRGRATRQSLSLEGLAGDQENLSRFNMTQKPAQATILHKCFHGPLIQQRDPDSRPQQRPAPQARCRYNWVTPCPPPTSCWVLPDALLCHLHGSLREAEGQGRPICCLSTCMLHLTGARHPAVVVQSFSCVRLFATPWTAPHQASLSFTISQFAQIFKFHLFNGCVFCYNVLHHNEFI